MWRYGSLAKKEGKEKDSQKENRAES